MTIHSCIRHCIHSSHDLITASHPSMDRCLHQCHYYSNVIPCASGSCLEWLMVHVTRRMYAFQLSLPDSLPPPVSFSPSHQMKEEMMVIMMIVMMMSILKAMMVMMMTILIVTMMIKEDMIMHQMHYRSWNTCNYQHHHS